MNNTVTVDFDSSKAANDAVSVNNGITYGQADGGLIKMPAGVDNVTWAIVLPQVALEAGTAGSAYTADNACTGIRPAIHEIERNKFYEDAIELVLNAAPTAPAGAINGLFSVSDTKQVYFSQGNLQYIGSVATWKFADNQWDCLGNNGQGSASETADRDLFGWGTSGHEHGATCWRPWSTSNDNSQYNPYNSTSTNLYDGDGDAKGKADWGYNAISNGGNTENIGWHTLTQSEWEHVINGRQTESGIRYAKATVNGVCGVILLPDNWKAETYTLNNYNTQGAGFSSNTITNVDEWTNILEANGAVFLPTTGYREKDNYGIYIDDVETSGYYWTASRENDNDARNVFVTSRYVKSTGSYGRHIGYSVRLVIPAE